MPIAGVGVVEVRADRAQRARVFEDVTVAAVAHEQRLAVREVGLARRGDAASAAPGKPSRHEEHGDEDGGPAHGGDISKRPGGSHESGGRAPRHVRASAARSAAKASVRFISRPDARP